MTRRLPFAFALVAAAAAAAAAACGDDAGGAPTTADGGTDAAAIDAGEDVAPVPKGDRTLGLGIDLASPGLVSAIELARDAGVATTPIALRWDDIEIAYDAGADADAAVALYAPALHAVNLILPDEKMGVVLSVDALDVGGARLPPDLVGRPIDDDAVATRYAAVEDYVFAETPDVTLTAFLVADRPSDAAFTTFLTKAVAHAHAVRPGVPVGFSVTSDDLVAGKDVLAGAIAAADVVAVDYLAADAAGKARSVASVPDDVRQVLAAVPAGKPVLFRAVGYPSAAASGGTEDDQAAFVSAVFAAWDRAPDRLKVLGFAGLDDLTDEQAAARAAALGRGADPTFTAMLGSLGFRTAGGRNKPSLGVFRSEARVRGF